MYTKADFRRFTQRTVVLAMCVGTLALTQAMAAEDTASVRAAPNALLSIDQNRSTVVDRIVSEWGDTLAKSNAGISVDQLRATLTGMRSDYLLAASVAGSLDGLRNVVASSLSGTAPVSVKGGAKVLGDSVDDLNYTPVVPCRILDTRGFGGAFAVGGETRSYHGVAGSFAGQGGAASNCNIPANPAALAMNIATVSGANFLTAWPFGIAQPLAATMNPANGLILSNGVIVPMCTPNCAFEFSIFTFGAQVIIDVVGYFAAPVATALQCTTVPSAGTTIAVSSDTLVPLPSCTAGYTRTGSTCTGTSGIPSGYLLETSVAGCLFRNLSSVATYQGVSSAVCCRIPGR